MTMLWKYCWKVLCKLYINWFINNGSQLQESCPLNYSWQSSYRTFALFRQTFFILLNELRRSYIITADSFPCISHRPTLTAQCFFGLMSCNFITTQSSHFCYDIVYIIYVIYCTLCVMLKLKQMILSLFSLYINVFFLTFCY